LVRKRTDKASVSAINWWEIGGFMASPHHPSGSPQAWKQLYQAAILELDEGKLLTRIADARCAIRDRATEALSESSLNEQQALKDALRTLRILEEAAEREKPAA
jgi:hypothetical protein